MAPLAEKNCIIRKQWADRQAKRRKEPSQLDAGTVAPLAEIIFIIKGRELTHKQE